MRSQLLTPVLLTGFLASVLLVVFSAGCDSNLKSSENNTVISGAKLIKVHPEKIDMISEEINSKSGLTNNGPIEITQVQTERIGGTDFMTVRGTDSEGGCFTSAWKQTSLGKQMFVPPGNSCVGYKCGRCELLYDENGEFVECSACLSPTGYGARCDHVATGD